MNVVEQVLLYIFLITGMINTLHLGMYVAGANVYDMWQYRRRARMPKRPQRRLPSVTVVVPAHNEAVSVERCLDSIRKTRYPHLQVIVHSDSSTDNTVKLIRAYQKQYKGFDLRVIDRRQRAGKAGGVNYAIKRYAKGELIMTLDADCVIHPDAIKHAVRYFADPKVAGVAANVRILDKRSVLGILQQFEHLIGYRSKKFFTITNCEFIVGGVASTYRRDILEAVGYYGTETQTEDIGLSMKVVALGNHANRIIYASDVVALTEGAHSFGALLKQRYRWKMGMLQNLFMHIRLAANLSNQYSRSLTLYRIPMALLSELILLLQPFVLGYIFYLSIVYQTPGFFLGAYLTITLYVLATIWPDEHMNWRRKLVKSAYAPALYFMFYIMDVVQIVAIVRCLFNPKQVALKGKHHNTSWTPPTRSGQQVQYS
jgi:poly-beta-1,6-N-acetyl-D-glucosamine synthase